MKAHERHKVEYEVETGEVKTWMVGFKDMGEQKEVTATEWINGEGFDVSVDSSKIMSMTNAELQALKWLLAELDV
jgi:hypothetical protein